MGIDLRISIPAARRGCISLLSRPTSSAGGGTDIAAQPWAKDNRRDDFGSASFTAVD
jgi:hypothetical protein